MITIEDLLRLMVERGGSDLHLTAGAPPKIRIHGSLVATEYPVLTPETSQKLLYSILDSRQIAKFEGELELDLSFGIEGLGRFRTNVFQQRGAVGGVMRVIPYKIKNFKELSLPEKVCVELCDRPKGLTLVTGATGSGKSTTLAAMIDYLNETRDEHVVTIEDPIEFVHRNKRCLFNQREVGSDTKGFKNALKSVLRQDPDIVLVGELRDMETIEAALTLSETGHLTFGTLHTSDAAQTIGRIVDVFPQGQQQQIRTLMSMTLNAVFCQQLIPVQGGKGRALASEIMICTNAIRALIRDDKAHQIYSAIQTGGKYGMMTMNQSLATLFKRGLIPLEEALSYSMDPEDLRRTIEKG